jgi:hypothetical protein
MDDEQYNKRLEDLRGQTADIAFAPDVYGQLRRLLTAVEKNLDVIDPYIIDLDGARLAALLTSLAPADSAPENPQDLIMRRLSHLDMFDIERIALTAEGYYAELGGADALGMSPPGLTALTETLGHMRKSCFAGAKRSAG